MEDSFKAMGIALSEDVYNDMDILQICTNVTCEKKDSNTSLRMLKYLSLDFLLEETNLQKFVDLARKSKWLPHYYNTLGVAFMGERNEKKVSQIFTNIIDIIAQGDPSANWKHIDEFVENAFNEEVLNTFKKRFLRFLRKKIFP